jgi:hypothetical protein
VENLAHSDSLSVWFSVPPHRGTKHLVGLMARP